MIPRPTHDDEVLDRAVQALRQTAAATSPPEELLVRIAAAGPTDNVARPGLLAWLRTRKTLLRCAAAALLVLLLWQAVERLGVLRPAPAFADVVERVGQTHSVFFRCTTTIEGQKPVVMNYTLAEPGFVRIQASAPANTILTFDETRSEGLLLLPDQKKAIALSTDAGVPRETASMIAWYRSLRQAKDRSVSDLGPRRIGVRETFGFRVKKKHEQDFGVVTAFDVWVDRKTSLPVQAQAKMTVQGLKASVLLEEFAFDANVPQSLCSLTPPEGYKMDGKTKLRMPAEKDLVQVLRLTAEANGSVFPDDVDLKTLQKAFSKVPQARALPGSPDFETGMQFASGLLFLNQRQTEGDWRYQGKGIKLGDAAHIVCAWRKKGAGEYRAIFGDLQIRNVPEAQLTARP
jgi:outer membrane lipoprotein-sorting protein